MPQVSIIIPSYNHEKYVEEAIESILVQTFQDFEIVITDDASADATVKLIKKYDDPRIKLICFEENRGACAAANSCIQNSTGELIALLNSDDVFVSSKLEKQVNFLDKHQEIGAVFSYAQTIDDEGNKIDHGYKKLFIQPNRTRFEWLNFFFFNLNCLCHPSILIRRTCYDQIGLYDERFAQLPDYDQWIRLCMKYEIHILPEELVKYRIRDNEANASGNRSDVRIRAQIELYEILKKNYFCPAFYDYLPQVFSGVKSFFYENEKLAPYLIASEALKSNREIHKFLALDTLYQVLDSSSIISQQLISRGMLSHTDLINVAGKIDIFSSEELKKIREELEFTQAKVFALENSFFGRLRNFWISFKTLFRLGRNYNDNL
jgi:glycosyltransferase involved in cell wall biosynthesis